MCNQCYGNCNWLMLNSSIWYQINDASGNKVGIKKDKSSSAAAVNSWELRHLIHQSMWVVSDFTLLSVHHMHHVCSLHVSDIMCIVFTSYPCIVHVSCVLCLHIICTSRVLYVYGSKYQHIVHYQIQISLSLSHPNRRSINRILVNVSDF